MPHYRDGSAAKPGELAYGKPYNTKHPVIGIVGTVIPGAGGCNLRIPFGEAEHVAFGASDASQTIGRGVLTVTGQNFDYGATADFIKIAEADGSPVPGLAEALAKLLEEAVPAPTPAEQFAATAKVHDAPEPA